MHRRWVIGEIIRPSEFQSTPVMLDQTYLYWNSIIVTMKDGLGLKFQLPRCKTHTPSPGQVQALEEDYTSLSIRPRRNERPSRKPRGVKTPPSFSPQPAGNTPAETIQRPMAPKRVPCLDDSQHQGNCGPFLRCSVLSRDENLPGGWLPFAEKPPQSGDFSRRPPEFGVKPAGCLCFRYAGKSLQKIAAGSQPAEGNQRHFA